MDSSSLRSAVLLGVLVFVLGACTGDGEGLNDAGDPDPRATINPAKDNTLYAPASALSNGIGNHLFAGSVGPTDNGNPRRALLAFDIAGTIPAGAIVTGVTLRLNMSRVPAGSPSATFALHVLTADWGEAASKAAGNEGQGGTAQTGDATWTSSFFNSTLWTNAGGDFAASPSATQTVGPVGSYQWQSSQMVGDVQAWLDTPATDFGWILIGDEMTVGSAKRFDSRENPTVGNRPELRVEYLIP